jgi:hypothetical protein
MCGEQVYYIQPRSYIHYLTTDEIIDRFISSNLCKTLECSKDIERNLYDAFLHKISLADIVILKERLETDILISQKMMYYIREFFYLHSHKKKSHRLKHKIGRFTRKK